jgi:hypothetical protein
MELYLWLIRVIHYMIVLFFVLAPFSNNQQILILHFILVPFLMLHWVTNQSACALTEMEKFLTGKTEDHETFIGKIVGPVYKFQSCEEQNMFVWGALILLWLFTLYKLRRSNFQALRDTFTLLRETLRR